MTERTPGSGKTSDPVGEIRFRVEVGDAPIGMFSECTGLAAEYELFEYQEGGQNGFTHKFRGRLKHPNLVLKRGLTNEDRLFTWFQEAAKEMKSRGTVKIEVIGPAGQVVRRWALAEALPVKWTGPNLNAGSTVIATESLEIAHHGFLPV